MFSLECCKCAKARFHCANDLVALRICAAAHLRGNSAGWTLLA